jgi:hypothetical protein
VRSGWILLIKYYTCHCGSVKLIRLDWFGFPEMERKTRCGIRWSRRFCKASHAPAPQRVAPPTSPSLRPPLHPPRRHGQPHPRPLRDSEEKFPMLRRTYGNRGKVTTLQGRRNQRRRISAFEATKFPCQTRSNIREGASEGEARWPVG